MLLFTTKVDIIILKSGTTFMFSYYFANIKVDPNDSLPIENISLVFACYNIH